MFIKIEGYLVQIIILLKIITIITIKICSDKNLSHFFRIFMVRVLQNI